MAYFWWFVALYLLCGLLANVWFANMPIFLSWVDRLIILFLWPLAFRP